MSEPVGVIHVYEAQSLTVYYTLPDSDGLSSIALNPGDNYILDSAVLSALISHPTLELLEGTSVLGISDFRGVETVKDHQKGLEVAVKKGGKKAPISTVGANGQAKISTAPIDPSLLVPNSEVK